MQLERLVIETGDSATVLGFHSGLTVVAGVDAGARNRLLREVVGALGPARSGIHLELTSDTGARFAFFRPVDAPHRVVSIDQRLDMTSHFADDRGRVSLIGRAGLDEAAVLAGTRIGSDDVGRLSEMDRRIHRLALCDHDELVYAAEQLLDRRDRLESESDAASGRTEDVETLLAAEERHAEAAMAHERAESRRRATYITAGVAGLASVPLVEMFGAWGALPPVLIATGSIGASLNYWRRQEAARREERAALADVGVESELGFHVQRVNVLLDADEDRRKMVKLAEQHRTAARAWNAIAGNEDPEWVLEHRARIAEMARAIRSLPGDIEDRRPGRASSRVYAVALRLASARSLGHDGERFPALLDDPFAQLDADEQQALLDMLLRAAQHQQIVLFTNTPLVQEWATEHAASGEIGLVHPDGADTGTSPSADRGRAADHESAAGEPVATQSATRAPTPTPPAAVIADITVHERPRRETGPFGTAGSPQRATH